MATPHPLVQMAPAPRVEALQVAPGQSSSRAARVAIGVGLSHWRTGEASAAAAPEHIVATTIARANTANVKASLRSQVMGLAAND